ncbi:hypothetical protein GCM10009790_21110 [Georgenia ruanii]
MRVTDRVVERIARTAVLQVDGVAPEGSTTGAIGGALGRTYPRVDCTVAGDHVRVSVEIEMLWPASAARVAREVQEAVADQLGRYAGLRADTVHVLVARVAAAAQEPRRVQ